MPSAKDDQPDIQTRQISSDGEFVTIEGPKYNYLHFHSPLGTRLFSVPNPIGIQDAMFWPRDDVLLAILRSFYAGVSAGVQKGRGEFAREFREMIRAAPITSITDLI